VGALIIGGSLGVLSAIFLAKFCPKPIKKIIMQVVNVLAGIPSVVYGLFGILVILPALGVFSPNRLGSGVLAVSIILGLMIIPTVVNFSKNAIEAVPDLYFEGALALGATKSQAVFKVVVPAAKSGILAGIIMGIGRALGETMAVSMVAGNRALIPTNLFTSFRTMTTNIVLERSYASGLRLDALIATGFILLIFALLINIAFNAIIKTGPKIKKYNPNAKPKKEVPYNTTVAYKIESRAAAMALQMQNTSYIPPPARKEKASASKVLSGTGKYASIAAAVIVIVALGAIIGFLLARGVGHINWSFLSTNYSMINLNATILPSFVVTLMLIILVMAMVIPLGVAAAIYLVEYTKKGSRLVKIIRLAVETLGSIPSVVYGLFGLMFFVRFLNMGQSIIAGACTVALMIIPITVRSTEEALKAVNDGYREGSYALGTGKVRTIFKVVLPSAMPGILSAVILGMGRIISESAALLFTMGSTLTPLPSGIGMGNDGTTLTTGLYYFFEEGNLDKAYATASVIIFFILILNITSTAGLTKLQNKLLGKTKTKKKKSKKNNEASTQ
jgi:phosphate transport system permease protein